MKNTHTLLKNKRLQVLKDQAVFKTLTAICFARIRHSACESEI